MSVSEDLINFDIIETQKENIQSLPQGRSAKALASAFAASPFSPIHTPGATRNLNDTFRAEYEAELQAIDDSDDPLDIYDRYVKWTFNAYPTAQATPESQLRPLLERATKAFQNIATYKNDPRYLKLWIHYIRLFSDAPREVFAYLSRHGIGEGLALYYEEFATWLEGNGRWNQAEEIYKLGIEKEARPSERLLRKFGEFQRRYDSQPAAAGDPSSPALPTIRPALAAKLDPYASTPRADDPQAQILPSAAPTSRNGRQKMTIFADADGSLAGKVETDPSKGWNSIGSIKDRKKENTVEAKPWAGETLKAGKKNGNVPKMAIFRDQSMPETNTTTQHIESPFVSLQETVNPKTGKLERIRANLACVYPNDKDEFCFAEVMARHRGWTAKDWSKEKQAIQSRKIPDENEKNKPATNLEDSSEQDMTSNVTKEITRDENNGKPRRKKVMEVKSEAQTVKLNLSSPTKTKKVRRKSTVEPTMTLHSRAATDEVLDMFNQTLRNVGSITEEPSQFDDSDYEDDDCTSGGESICNDTERLSGVGSEYGEETEAIDGTLQVLDATTSLDDNSRNTENNLTVGETSKGGVWPEVSVREDGLKLAALDTSATRSDEEVKTPESEHPDTFGPHFMPSPPEGVHAPTHPYRDAAQMNQNRLPFMTPIVEMTESSVSLMSSRRPGDHISSKTPSRRRHDGEATIPELEDLILEEEITESYGLLVVEETQGVQLDDPTEPSTNEDEILEPECVVLERGLPIPEPDGSDPAAVDTYNITEDTSPQPNTQQPELDVSLKQPVLLDPIPSTDASQNKVRTTIEAIGTSNRDVVIFDDHVNPVDEEVRQKIIKTLAPPLSSYPGYYNHTPESSQIKSELDKLSKAGTKKIPKSTTEKTDIDVEFKPSPAEVIVIKQLIGKGGWASVFLVERQSNNGQCQLQAMKSEFDPSAWEFAIMTLAHARIGSWSQLESNRTNISIAKPLSLYSYSDAVYMFESFHEQGNLLELVNKIKADALPAGSASGASTPGIDEHLAMFFAIEILRTVSDMHSVGILHCDIKADNFLVRLSPTDEAEEEWSAMYSPSGENGWSEKGIVLIDFGRAIDTLAFKPDTCFYAEWATDKHDCPEQREARPWTHQADLWGMASIFSVLLFGKVLEEMVVADSVSDSSSASMPINSNSTNNKRYKPRENLKRYWQTEIWTDAFDVLMNPAQHATQSEKVGRGLGGIKGLPASKLKSVRKRMEQFLVEHGEKKGLKQSIKKLEEKIGSAGYYSVKKN